jgi:hypothetical protein
MPIAPEEFERARERVAQITREREQAVGALKELRRGLVREFGVKSDEQATALQAKLDKEVAKLEKECRDALAELDRKWGDRLDDTA